MQGFIPFEVRLKKLAEANLLKFSIPKHHPTLPAGDYIVKPSFCLDIKDGCDCRKTILNVYNKEARHLAAINFGWEDPSYYLQEFKGVKDADQITGIFLEELVSQSELAQAILVEVKNILEDFNLRKNIENLYNVWYQCLTGENRAEVLDFDTAITIINQQLYGVPYNAIEFLRLQKDSKELKKEIIFALLHAYDGTYFDKEYNWQHATPLWFAVVAETHITDDLIEPVLDLFAEHDEEDWDFLNEQGETLLRLLVAKYPKETIKKTKKFLEQQLEESSSGPYLFTSAVFEHETAQAEINWFIKFLSHPNNYWKGFYADFVDERGWKQALPALKEMLICAELDEDDFESQEIAAAINSLESQPEQREFKEKIDTKPEDWQEYFKNIEDRFYPDKGQEDFFDEEFEEKTGQFLFVRPNTPRNAPCPCGSGKKYKKCHGK